MKTTRTSDSRTRLAAPRELRADGKQATMTACVVIPTYNEAGNITKLLDEIYANARKHHANARKRQARGWDVDLSVLVVDDNSPDGTAAIVRTYAATNPRVHLLHRSEKQGLGAAYIAGMSHAMALLDPEVILEMDADFSHDPRVIFELLAWIHDGADFVIGSRYVKGGSIPENWGLHRRLISKAANLYTKIVLRIPGVKDCSGGFRAIRSSLLQRINLASLNVKGYAFQVLLLEEAIRAGALVREVPIAFQERDQGKSKMRLTDMVEGALLLLRVGVRRFFIRDDVDRTPRPAASRMRYSVAESERDADLSGAHSVGSTGSTGSIGAIDDAQQNRGRIEI